MGGQPNGPTAGHPPITPALCAALALVAALTLAPVWIAPYPAGVDVPQHAAQVAVAAARADPSWPHGGVFELNPLAPHLVGFGLVRAVSLVAPVPVAFAIVLSAALLALPLATRRLLRGRPYDPWWLLPTLPVGLGYAFRWGFVHYLVAIPLVIWFTAVALDYAGAPGRRRGARLAALSLLLLVTHVIGFATATLIGAAMVLASAGRPGQRLARLLPLVPAPAIGLAWVLVNRGGAAATGTPDVWYLGWHRLAQLPAWLVGEPVGAAAVLTGTAFLLLPFAGGGRPVRTAPRLVPLAVVLLLHFLVPKDLFGTASLYPRFAVFVLPFLLLALDLRRPARPLLRAALPLAVSGLWLTTLALEHLHYRREMLDLRALSAAVEPGRRVLYLPVERGDPALPGPVYLHSGAWLQVERRAIVDYSFADVFTSSFRYAPGQAPALPYELHWSPQQFRWREHDGRRFDCFLVHAGRDLGAYLLRGAPAPPRLELRSGAWWLYSIPAGGGPACVTPPADRRARR